MLSEVAGKVPALQGVALFCLGGLSDGKNDFLSIFCAFLIFAILKS